MDELKRKESRFDVEEFGVGFVRFENNTVMEVAEAWAINLDDLGGDYIVGSEGGIRLKPFRFISTIEDIEFISSGDVDAADFRWHGLDPDEEFYDSSEKHWIAALQGRVELINSADIALRCMLIQEGLYLSNEKNREVDIDEIIAASKSKTANI